MNQMIPVAEFSVANAMPPGALENLVADMKQWMIGPGSGPIFLKRQFDGRPERNYNLRSLEIDRFLQHEKQRFGINLGWTDDASPQTAAKVRRWFFARAAGDDSPLRYAEVVALANGGSPSFVRYEERTVGVNLGWSDKPVYEWKVLGGQPGSQVAQGQRVALYNMKSNECLIHFDRSAGGDIGWPTSQRWEDKLKSLAISLGKEAVKKAVLAALGA